MDTLRRLPALFILALAAGCSDGPMDPQAEGPDASPSDPTADAGDVDAKPQLTACTLHTQVGGILAVLHDADGAVIASGTTDSTGSITWDDCPADAMFSFAAYEDALDGWRGVTVAGVQPGSDFKVLLPEVGWKGTVVANIPEDGAELTTERLYIGSRCNTSTDEGAAQELAVTADCLGANPEAISVLATGRIDDVWVFSHSQSDVTFNANGVTNVGLEDMTGWMTGGYTTLSVVNAPSASVSFKMEWMRNGLSFGSSSWIENAEAGQAQRVIPTPPSGFTSSRRVGVSSLGVARKGYIVLTEDPSMLFDLEHGLPEITDLEMDTTDPLRPVLSANDVPADADLGMFRSHWFNADAKEVIWQVIIPTATMSSVRFPELPAALADANPTESFELDEMSIIDMTDADYDGILGAGYTIGKHQMNCGEVTPSNECRFGWIQY